jgi:O-antigen/teichoic acid export membrane protein
MLGYGWPVFLSSLIMGLITQYTQFLLPWFTSNMEIGNYRVAVNVSMILMIINWSIAVPLFPAMSKLDHKNEPEKTRILFTSSIKYSTLFIVPTALLIVLMAKELVFVFFGPNYTLAPAYLSMYVLLHMYVLLGSLSVGNFLLSQADTRAWLKMNLIYASMALPLTFLFIGYWGVPGLILALVVSSAPFYGYGLVLVYRKYGLHPDWFPLIKILFVSLLSAIATYYTLRVITVTNELPHILISIVIFALCYLVFLPLMGAISIKDLDDLSTVMSRMKLTYIIARPLLHFEERLLKLKDRWKFGS